MLDGKNLFILGAGANTLFGFPTGQRLRELICTDYLQIYHEFINNCEIADQQKQHYICSAEEFVEHFSQSANPSIDFFLANNPQYIDRGKEAIALLILRHEQLSQPPGFRISETEDWHSYFLSQALENIRDELNCEDRWIHFVTFNYDRSLEYYTHWRLTHSLAGQNIERMLLRTRFVHVYGQAGRLAWQRERTLGELDYGFNSLPGLNLVRVRDVINLMFDAEESPAIQEARHLVAGADRIFFLGFGFSPQNLSILGIPAVWRERRSPPNLYGTARIIGRKLETARQILSQNAEVRLEGGMNCRELLEHFL